MIQDAVKDAMIFIKSELAKEIEAQGHRHSGKLIESIEYHIAVMADTIVAQIFMNDYWVYVNYGVHKDRIPYQRGSGKKSSKYIAGLIKYFSEKGYPIRKAKGMAFATANKHKQEGMPTSGSYLFSNNGKRTGFVIDTIDREFNTIIDYLEASIGDELDKQLTEILTRIPTAA